MTARERLIVAIDTTKHDEAISLVEELSPAVDIFKVGLAAFMAFGGPLIDRLTELGKKIFLDLKFHDIPNTAASAVRAAVEKKVFMINLHCLGGLGMMEAAKNELARFGEDAKQKAPLLIGVTVLTSSNEESLRQIGLSGSVEENVIRLARLAARAGLDGVVAAAEEAELIKNDIGKNFLVVTPGIRPEWAAKPGDQKRVLTPREAIRKGADYIVVGRPIIRAKSPLDAAKRIIDEIEM